MTEEDIRLVEPGEQWEAAYRDFLADFEAAGEQHQRKPLAECDFDEFLQGVRHGARGENLPEGYVAGQTYWLVAGERIVAASGLRFELTDALRDYGGNIGYAVRPSERRKGHATRMLALVLNEARQRGMTRVLITCDKDNTASAKVIRNSGGVLDSEAHSEAAGRVTQRYWIEL